MTQKQLPLSIEHSSGLNKMDFVRRSFKKITAFFLAYIQEYMPDPYIFAILLTFIAGGMNLWLIPQATVSGVINTWYQGVWGTQNIFAFTLQMTLILISGTTLAKAPLIKKMLIKLASVPKNQVQAAILCFLIGAVGSFINWGLGLVVGTILAIEIAKRLDVDFGYIVAAAYMGFIVWTSGLSSSIALASTDPESALNIVHKMTAQTISMQDSIFTSYNLIAVLMTLLIFPFMLKWMAPDKIKPMHKDFLFKEDEIESPKTNTWASTLENASLFNTMVVLCGFYQLFVNLKGSITINSVILLFVLLGLLLHRTPIRYVKAFTDAAKMSGSLLLQYPLYGGIMALIAYVPEKGIEPLHTLFASKMIETANVQSLPFLNFLGSCIITMFVPSGGGHWAVQGPVSIQAALALGQSSPAYLGKIAMSVAFGEGVFNMIQPFWALPVLALAGLNIRDIMGYCAMAMLFGFGIFGLALLLI